MSIAKRDLLGWCLFDFANSVLIINGALYFPQWFVVNNRGGDLWFNASLIISTVIVFFTAPHIGFLSDEKIHKRTVLAWCAVFLFASTLSLAVIDRSLLAHGLRVTCGMVAFICVLCSYQIGSAIYNSMLSQYADQKDFIRVSGYGAACSWAGAIVGILFVLPFVRGQYNLFGPPGPGAAFLPAAVMYGVITICSIALMRAPRRVTPNPNSSLRSWRKDLTTLLRNKDLMLFLISFVLFSDAILTIGSNAPLYLGEVMHFSDSGRAMLFLLLFTCMAIGALLPDLFKSRVNTKQAVIIALVGWCIILLPVSLIHSQNAFAACFGIIGLLYGALINLSRVVFILLSPKNQLGQYFGIYTSFERVATFLGPALWALVAVGLASLGPDRYRYAMLTMDALLICGLYAFTKVPLTKIADV